MVSIPEQSVTSMRVSSVFSSFRLRTSLKSCCYILRRNGMISYGVRFIAVVM